MKDRENSLIPEDWKKVPQKDWERMKRNLRDNDVSWFSGKWSNADFS